MSHAFAITSVIVLVASAAAVSLRRPVHSVLCLTIAFAGLAALYLQLGAEFVGFAQILIYVGAVAILMVFAILLTQSGGSQPEVQRAAGSAVIGISIAVLVFGCLVICILASTAIPPQADTPSVTTRQIGEVLMTRFVLPLQVLGLLLTAALIGAVLIAMGQDKGTDKDSP
jgi:NADH-quinone oxidoreductase subunit J